MVTEATIIRACSSAGFRRIGGNYTREYVEHELVRTSRCTALRYALLPASQLTDEVRQDIGGLIQSGEDEAFLVTGPVGAAAPRREAVRAFEDKLDASTDPLTKATIPSALRVAGALTQIVADWCAAEIERQSTSGSNDLGFDLRTGTVRGVAITLTDVLQGHSA